MQMLLKIGVARHVRSQFYITLDSDCFAKRPFAFSDIVDSRGSALIQGEDTGGRHSTAWWDAAERIMAGPSAGPSARPCVASAGPKIGVTPAVLARQVSLGLMENVERLWRPRLGRVGAWDELLFKLLG